MYKKYFNQLKEECLIRNRSSQTAETYIANIKVFMNWTGNKPIEELSLQDARDFILFKRKSGVSASTCIVEYTDHSTGIIQTFFSFINNHSDFFILQTCL